MLRLLLVDGVGALWQTRPVLAQYKLCKGARASQQKTPSSLHASLHALHSLEWSRGLPCTGPGPCFPGDKALLILPARNDLKQQVTLTGSAT